MFGALMWAFVWLSLAVGVVPIAAMLVRDDKRLQAALVLVVFAGGVSLTSPVRAAEATMGPIGEGMQTVSCTPGYQLMAAALWSSALYADGLCPESGSVVCGMNSPTQPAQQQGVRCYQFQLSAGEGGGGTGTSVSLKPFDMPAEDGALISGAILAVWCSGWAIRAVIDTLRDRKDGD